MVAEAAALRRGSACAVPTEWHSIALVLALKVLKSSLETPLSWEVLASVLIVRSLIPVLKVRK